MHESEFRLETVGATCPECWHFAIHRVLHNDSERKVEVVKCERCYEIFDIPWPEEA